jgi:hypothetical protein
MKTKFIVTTLVCAIPALLFGRVIWPDAAGIIAPVGVQFVFFIFLAVVEALSSIDLFWRQVRKELRTSASIISSDELFSETKTIDELKLQATDKPERQRIPGIYSHDPRNGAIGPIVEVFRASGSKRKLVVVPDNTHSVDNAGDCVIRHSSNSPPLLSAAGVVCLPLNGRWVRTLSRNVASVLWRIGFSHLADDEINPMQAARFFCPDCANGNLVLKRIVGEGWFIRAPLHLPHTSRRPSSAQRRESATTPSFAPASRRFGSSVWDGRLSALAKHWGALAAGCGNS